MLKEEWEHARRLVSSAAAGPPRQTLARALIPAAIDASAFEIATRLIEDNHLVPEFPAYGALVVSRCRRGVPVPVRFTPCVRERTRRHECAGCGGSLSRCAQLVKWPVEIGRSSHVVPVNATMASR